MKFKYHYLNNTLQTQKPFSEIWNQIPEDKQFQGSYETQGFILEPHNHWISFQVKEKTIKVFYKLPESPEGSFTNNLNDDFWTNEKITYYRKYLTKQEEVIFTFEAVDQIEKVNGKWVRKNKVLSETKGEKHENN